MPQHRKIVEVRCRSRYACYNFLLWTLSTIPSISYSLPRFMVPALCALATYCTVSPTYMLSLILCTSVVYTPCQMPELYIVRSQKSHSIFSLSINRTLEALRRRRTGLNSTRQHSTIGPTSNLRHPPIMMECIMQNSPQTVSLCRSHSQPPAASPYEPANLEFHGRPLLQNSDRCWNSGSTMRAACMMHCPHTVALDIWGKISQIQMSGEDWNPGPLDCWHQ